jgi:hypothetical protein
MRDPRWIGEYCPAPVGMQPRGVGEVGVPSGVNPLSGWSLEKKMCPNGLPCYCSNWFSKIFPTSYLSECVNPPASIVAPPPAPPQEIWTKAPASEAEAQAMVDEVIAGEAAERRRRIDEFFGGVSPVPTVTLPDLPGFPTGATGWLQALALIGGGVLLVSILYGRPNRRRR